MTTKDQVLSQLKEKLAAAVEAQKAEVAKKVLKEAVLNEAKRATPDSPEWEEAIKRAHEVMKTSKLSDEHKKNGKAADLLYNTHQNVPKRHFKKFLAAVGVSADPKFDKELSKAENAPTKKTIKEDHYSEDELDDMLGKFEKSMNHAGIKAVEDYISAEADGNKAKAALAANKIKKALKESE